MKNIKRNILTFENKKVDPTIISNEEIEFLVDYLIEIIDNKIEGDVVELGCYVGESSKYLMKTLLETESNKRLYVYDSFDGLPELSEYELHSGWVPGTLKTTEDVILKNFYENGLPAPIVCKSWFKDIPEYKIPNKISFAFLDGDFYDSIYDSLVKIYNNVQKNGVIILHDYDRPDLPGVKIAVDNFFKERNINIKVKKLTGNLGVIIKNEEIILEEAISNDNKLTLVTGLWNIGRDTLQDGWARSFQHYIDKFIQLMKIECNMIIFGDDEIENIVKEYRDLKNTQFIKRSKSWFTENEYYQKIQNIRKNPDWYNQVGWLKESTQCRLEMYNPLVMSKMFLLHDAKILDKFNSENLFWIDAGITNTVHSGYFTHDKVMNNLQQHIKDFHFICFPYETNTEIHGFKYDEMLKFSNSDVVNKVARGGFFGGKKEKISQANNLYYSILIESLNKGFMGTEESIFTIMIYKYPELFSYSSIEENGLLGKFFEDLKNNKILIEKEKNNLKVISNLDINKTALYVIGFNSPSQFETLINSMLVYDNDFLFKTEKFLLNNSTDRSTDTKYFELCEKHNFKMISTGENLGICGGRQFIAEHFNSTELDFYLFFEDDMFFYNGEETTCRNGFNRYVKNLYSKSMKIMQTENFDFLKFNFTEFYGDNGTQWSWYNVPQIIREEYWPQYSKLPEMGTDPNAPKTKIDEIHTIEDLSYVTGEIYYCNWPQIVSRDGNKKMFLETKWARPFEQTWMSFMFQETKKGKIKPALLLATPTEHNRFEHYSSNLRKES